jgi:hypothetical protein
MTAYGIRTKQIALARVADQAASILAASTFNEATGYRRLALAEDDAPCPSAKPRHLSTPLPNPRRPLPFAGPAFSGCPIRMIQHARRCLTSEETSSLGIAFSNSGDAGTWSISGTQSQSSTQEIPRTSAGRRSLALSVTSLAVAGGLAASAAVGVANHPVQHRVVADQTCKGCMFYHA